MNNNQKLTDLIQSIEGLLSKDRCPLTGEDEILLRNCLVELKELKDKNNPDLFGSLEKVTKWLLLLFKVYETIAKFL